MSAFPDFHLYDGLGLAELVRHRAVSPIELVDEAIGRIEARHAHLNLISTPMFEQARQAARQPLPQGAFSGVPFLLKDLAANWQGVPTASGNRLLANLPAQRDSELVRRYKAAGLIVLAKTNTPEFGLTPYTEPKLFGPSRNPWNPKLTPGGSSGGSAAAVAARTVPMAHGGDGGGSIRIPASCCGLFGFKPTRGRTPTGPDHGELWAGFAVEHAITRSVRDSAALLDATAGTDIGAPYCAPIQRRPFLAEVTTAPGRLRIAYCATPLLGSTVHPDCLRGLEQTVSLLRELGHEVHEASPPIDSDAWAIAFTTVLAAQTRVDIETAAQRAGRAPAYPDFEPATYVLGLLGRALSASEYASALRYLHIASRAVGVFFQDYDILLTPTLARPPAEIGSLTPSRAERALLTIIGRLGAGWLLKAASLVKPMAQKSLDFIPFTPPFNITGQPAMSVPLCWNQQNIPIGMQFVGRFGDEATLFRLAGQLETARPWFDRAPAGC